MHRVYLRYENGELSMVLMADGCPVCHAFGAAMTKNALRRAMKPMSIPSVSDDGFEKQT